MYHHIDICDYIVLLACVDNAVLISYKISDNGVEKKYQIIKPQLTEGDGIGTLDDILQKREQRHSQSRYNNRYNAVNLFYNTR